MEVVRPGEVIKEIAKTQFMRIIERFVKNDTPYIGKLVLKFEKNPFYKSLKKGFLNKVHFNLGFLKIVTRIIPKIEGREIIIDETAKVIIEKYTSCSLNRKVELNEEADQGSVIVHNLIFDKKHYWGDIDFGWWMLKNQIMVSQERPRFLAFKYENRQIIGAYIKLNQGGIDLKIGDRIFESDFRPSSPFYEQDYWKKVSENYNRDLKRANKETKVKIMREGFKKYIPIQQLGRFKIETKEDLILSAERIFDFLSK